MKKSSEVRAMRDWGFKDRKWFGQERRKSNKCFGILRKRAIDRDQSHISKSIHLKMRVERRGITHLVISEKMTVNNSLCFA